MAAREFGMGLVKGLSSVMKEHGQERAAEKKRARELKHLGKVGKLQLQMDRERKEAELEDVLDQLEGSGVDEKTLKLAFSGLDLGKTGMRFPHQMQSDQAKLDLLGAQTARQESLSELDRIRAEAGGFAPRRGTSTTQQDTPEIKKAKWWMEELNKELKNIQPKWDSASGEWQDTPEMKDRRAMIGQQIRQLAETLGVPMPEMPQAEAPPPMPVIPPLWGMPQGRQPAYTPKPTGKKKSALTDPLGIR